MAEEDSVNAAMDNTIATYQKLDIMINCAGIVGPTKIKTDEIVTKDFDQVYAVNLRGSFLVTKAALPHMKNNDCESSYRLIRTICI